MKRLFTFVAVVALLLVSSCCKYDDSELTNRIDNLESRIEQLEELCKQMNINISSLQSIVNALQNNDYVTSVTPIIEGGETIGYTITFTMSDPITIYHGKNGEAGQDGHTPIVGVKQDSDGIYYWTLDGEWITDNNGNKIKAQGINGTDGEDGQDGITPQLKIENDFWYVSYDNGESWIQLDKATGENGLNGDSMFKDVSQDDDKVYFTLADGSIITLFKYRELTIAFSQQTNIPIILGQSTTITYTIKGGGENPIIEVITFEGWTAEIVSETAISGTLTVTCPQNESQNKKVIVFVSDGKGRTTMASLTFTYNSEEQKNELYIPDANFKTFLLENVDMDEDGILTETDAKAWNEHPSIIKEFNVSARQIKSLEGLKYFLSLKALYCTSNQLTSLDISDNPELETLNCSNNQLSSLIFGNNNTLKNLYCETNQLSALDVSTNHALERLHCWGNQLSNLNVSSNTSLRELRCEGNNLKTLNVSTCTELRYLNCAVNQLEGLWMDNLTQLETLYCQQNILTHLSIEGCSSLKILNCANNQLSFFDTSRSGIGNSTELYPLNCANMPNLRLFLRTGWEIEGININRSSEYIDEQAIIMYSDI